MGYFITDSTITLDLYWDGPTHRWIVETGSTKLFLPLFTVGQLFIVQRAGSQETLILILIRSLHNCTTLSKSIFLLSQFLSLWNEWVSLYNLYISFWLLRFNILDFIYFEYSIFMRVFARMRACLSQEREWNHKTTQILTLVSLSP